MSDDNALNYPERPRVLDMIVSQAFKHAGEEHGLTQEEINRLTDIVFGDEQYRVAAEEFEADRADQYEHLFEEPSPPGPTLGDLLREQLKYDHPTPTDHWPATGYERPDLRTPDHDPFNPPGFERQQFYPRMIPNPAHQPTTDHDDKGYFGNTLPGSGINTLYFGEVKPADLITPDSVDQAERDSDSRTDR